MAKQELLYGSQVLGQESSLIYLLLKVTLYVMFKWTIYCFTLHCFPVNVCLT